MKFAKHVTYKGNVPKRELRNNNKRQKTVVWEIKNPDTIFKLPNAMIFGSMDLKITLDMGIAIVHPLDEYNKAKGLTIAEKNKKEHSFTVTNIGIFRDKESIIHVCASTLIQINPRLNEMVTLIIDFNCSTRKVYSDVICSSDL